MRHVLIAAAALATSGLLATAANAQTYEAGGPVQVGNMCRVSTDGSGMDAYGYYAPCAIQASAQAPAKRSRR